MNHRFLGATAGISLFVVMIVILGSLFIESADNLGIFLYCFLATVAIIFAKAYGENMPYMILGGMLLLALVLTPFWTAARKKSKNDR